MTDLDKHDTIHYQTLAAKWHRVLETYLDLSPWTEEMKNNISEAMARRAAASKTAMRIMGVY